MKFDLEEVRNKSRDSHIEGANALKDEMHPDIFRAMLILTGSRVEFDVNLCHCMNEDISAEAIAKASCTVINSMIGTIYASCIGSGEGKLADDFIKNVALAMFKMREHDGPLPATTISPDVPEREDMN